MRGGLAAARLGEPARRRTAGSSPAAWYRGLSGGLGHHQALVHQRPQQIRHIQHVAAAAGPAHRLGGGQVRSRRRTPTGRPAAPARPRSAANRPLRPSPAGSAGVPQGGAELPVAAETADPAAVPSSLVTSTAAAPRPARWPAASVHTGAPTPATRQACSSTAEGDPLARPVTNSATRRTARTSRSQHDQVRAATATAPGR